MFDVLELFALQLCKNWVCPAHALFSFHFEWRLTSVLVLDNQKELEVASTSPKQLLRVRVRCACLLCLYARFSSSLHSLCPFHPPFHSCCTHHLHSYHTHSFDLAVIVHVDACVQLSLAPLIDVVVLIVHAVRVWVVASSVARHIYTCLRAQGVCRHHTHIHLTLTRLTLDCASVEYVTACSWLVEAVLMCVCACVCSDRCSRTPVTLIAVV